MCEKLIHIEQRFVIDVLEHEILDLAYTLKLLTQIFLVKQLADLEADFGVLVRIERCNTALC